MIGVGLALAFAAWIGAVAAIVGGRPWPMIGLVLGVLGSFLGGRAIAGRSPLLPPVVVAVAPLVAVLIHRSSWFGDGPLGYSNASGALFFVAACAAVLAGLTVRQAFMRVALFAVAATWIAMTWALGASAAGVLAILLPIAVVSITRPKAVRGTLRAGAGITLAGLAFATALGAAYQPGGRGGLTQETFDAHLGELRVVLWKDALELLRSAPITGVGPDKFRAVSPTALSRDDALWAHNEYLQVAAETGIPGLILLLALVLWAFGRLGFAVRDHRAVPAIVAVGGVSLHANIDYIWHFPEVPLALAALIGAASSLRRERTVRRLSRERHAIRKAVGATLALWLVLLLPIDIINPRPAAPNGAEWAEGGSAIRFHEPGMVRSRSAPQALYERLISSQELTLELWAAAYDLKQSGPARIVSASNGIRHRNFTLGQQGHQLVFRLRTTETDWNGTDPHLVVDSVFGTTALQHIVVATNLQESSVYLDGSLHWRGAGPGGRLDNWIDAYPLLLGNESNGSRPWRGEIRALSLYDYSLERQEIERLYLAGTSAASGREVSLQPEPVAAYRFEPNRQRTTAAAAVNGIAPVLEIPSRIPASSSGLWSTLLDSTGWSTYRVVAHALLFALWAAVLFGIAHRWLTPPVAGVLVTAAGLTMLLAATGVRYLSGRSPSLVDFVGLIVGLTLAGWVHVASTRRGTA